MLENPRIVCLKLNAAAAVIEQTSFSYSTFIRTVTKLEKLIGKLFLSFGDYATHPHLSVTEWTFYTPKSI